MNAGNRRSRNWEDFRELRRLLTDEDRARQAADENTATQPVRLSPEDLSDLLPDAIVHRAKRDKQLARSLTPIFEESFDAAVQRDPQRIVDAIFPVMGPAIRKSIAETLKGMIQSLNATLEHSLSAKGLKWRFEAMRTGKPFAEVALSHSLLFRVEQVFLIHRESGLLLAHAAAEAIDTTDGDMISGMLTAIQDFVYDSFAQDKAGSLETLEVGDLSVWIEQGPKAVLAAVIRGEAPRDLRRLLGDALESIHLEMRTELSDFDGDSSPFERIMPAIQGCLRVQTEDEAEDKKRSYTAVWVLGALVLIGAAIWAVPTVKTQVGKGDFLARLNEEPGIMITETGREGGALLVRGLRDPLAADPYSIAIEAGYDTGAVRFRWEQYQSLEEPFVVARASAILRPPDGVIFGMTSDGDLLPTGRAPHAWIVNAQQLARTIPGVRRMLADELVDTDLERIANRIERERFYFDVGSSTLGARDRRRMSAIVTMLNDLHGMAAEIGKQTHVQIVGQADTRGSDELNLRISQARANTVRSELVSAGLEPLLFSATGVGARQEEVEPGQGGEEVSSRRVTFEVSFVPSGARQEGQE